MVKVAPETEIADTEVASSASLDASDVAIIVPVGGAAPAWPRSAQSLAELEPKPGEIIAVIDGPQPAHEAVANGISATVLVLEQRGGPSVARNHGARATTRPILLFVDSDVEVPPDLAAQVAAIFNERPELSACIGSYDDRPGDPGLISQYRNLLHHHVHQEGRERASTFWAGCGAIRRSVFIDMGGFDEDFAIPSIEDIELGTRMIRARHNIGLVKNLQVTHLKRWRLADMLKTDLLQRAAPWTQLMLADGELVNDLNVKSRDRVSVAAAFLLPVALAGAVAWPPLLLLAAAAALVLAVLNAGFFRFLLHRRGVIFTLAAVPLYWLYLVVCGLGFGLGLLRHLVSSTR
jgi:glycosyltransferase involved in cell wall biosynthesis